MLTSGWPRCWQPHMPLLCAVGFLFLFAVGGLTGVVLANSGLAIGLLCGGPLSLCALDGRGGMPGSITILYAPRLLGLIHLWIFGIGVNIVFLPMHGLGLAAMPRRIPDYPTA